MATTPMPLRLEPELHGILAEGARRTPHKKQELIRITLRRHLATVIAEEAPEREGARLTNLKPWPKGTLATAYRRQEKAWEATEAAATRAQGQPAFED